jgi:hypothetical protein
MHAVGNPPGGEVGGHTHLSLQCVVCSDDDPRRTYLGMPRLSDHWTTTASFGQPAGGLIDIADRHRLQQCRCRPGRRPPTPLPATLIVEASRVSAPLADHLGRVRIAATLGLHMRIGGFREPCPRSSRRNVGR